MHALPARTLLGTFAALLALTALTVAASRVDFGQLNVVVAIGIAVLKAALVALFFMHLKYESKFQLTVLVSAVVFAALFTTFVAFDTTQYQRDIQAKEAQPLMAPRKAEASAR